MLMRLMHSIIVVMGLVLTLGGILPAMAQDTGADERTMHWSPDGTQIAFLSNRTGQQALYVMDADGENTRVLMADFPGLGFAWSPAGTHMAYSAGDWETLGLYILTLETGEIQTVAENDFANEMLSWSPDGQLLLYRENQNNGIGTVKLYSLEDQNSYPLTDEKLNVFDGTWSPDGHLLAIRGYNKTAQRYTIYVYDVQNDTLSENLLEDFEQADGCCDYPPEWSPDGERLGFRSRNYPHIYGINLQTKEVEPLVDSGVTVNNFKWLSDGRLLYLVEFRDPDTLRDYDGSTPPGLYVTVPGETPQLVADGVSTWFYLAPNEQHVVLQNIYTSTYHGKNQPRALELIDLDTFDLIEINTFDSNSNTIEWSPDSTRMAGALCIDGDYDIIVMDGVSGEFTNLTPDDAFTDEPITSECGVMG